MFLGLLNGEIRVCRVNAKDYTDFSDYWTLSMHDNYYGFISKMLISYDNKMLLTCGHDGNLFSYVINEDTRESEHEIPKPKLLAALVKI